MKKNLYFILAQENLFHPYYFEKVLQCLDRKKFRVVGVTVAKERYKKGFVHSAIKQRDLWGTVGFCTIAILSSLTSLLTVCRLKKNGSIKSICRARCIPYIESLNVNERQHLIYLRKYNIDIIISSNGHIFGSELLYLPRIACINRHTALLPKYGGVMPVFWAMLNREKAFGVSVHYMVEEIDKGDILYQIRIPFTTQNSLFRNYINGFEKSVDATIRALSNVLQGKIVRRYRKNAREYFHFPNHDEMHMFHQRHVAFRLSDIRFLGLFQHSVEL